MRNNLELNLRSHHWFQFDYKATRISLHAKRATADFKNDYESKLTPNDYKGKLTPKPMVECHCHCLQILQNQTIVRSSRDVPGVRSG